MSWSRVPVKSCLFALEMSLGGGAVWLVELLVLHVQDIVLLLGHALAVVAVPAGPVAIAGIASAAVGATAAATLVVGIAPVGASRSRLIRPCGCCGGDGGRCLCW